MDLNSGTGYLRTHERIALYLAGTIKKDCEDPNESFWTAGNIEELRGHLAAYDVTFLNPAIRTDDLSDERSVFGRDRLQVYASPAVFAYLRNRRGLGVGAEML